MNKIIIVGATSGIGLELTKIFIHKGWRVGIAGRREHLLSTFKKNFPEQVEYEVIDITEATAPQKLTQLIHKIGGMDIYFHSSGVGFQNPQLTLNIELQTVKTNVLGFTQLIDTAFQHFEKTEKGHIAVISSIAGTKGLGVAPAYSATKRFQNTYIDALEQLAHLKKLNIHFTDIKPGFVQTALLDGGGKYPLLMNPQKVADKIYQSIVNKKRSVIIDWKYRLIVTIWKLIPHTLWKRLPIKTR